MAAIERYARYRFAINRVFHDHRTKYAPSERDSYQTMLRYSQDNDIEHIILYNLPQFSRNLDQSLEELKNLTASGYTVYFADQGFIGYLDEPEKRREAILNFISFMDTYQGTLKKGGSIRPKPVKKTGRSIGRPKALDPGQLEALLTVRRAGTSIGQICRMFNVSRSTVSKILADYPELKGEWKGNRNKAS